ncbi:MAG: bifunctional phosphopantothenoylcysteine decarboxylase/phosphopantothenate--cysteine ligase CoaBC [Deltaproteobacteria bacterium]|nr:bifunctional phosphopantothenoylcysteine decarboxylase/phosphopantothenate--cysteine ligase CoaBC [Deltaproteobacteria bacterium]MBW2205703.1 bifunctional phosphopantothenoylcysteine decarboxylase/phosphopantothenate--cysteine ligase CoaBC [Deltaproteobacteria bacterium]
MKDKNVIVGVTGGIACYKAAELVRMLVKAGASTRVAMTKNATRFVAPLTFETLSGNRVVWDMFHQATSPMDHISWGQETDLIIIAPATANFIGKMAHGICDDFLSTMVLAATAKILICPAMNSRMFENPAVQENIERLRQGNHSLMAPGEGQLACGYEGPGRLPEPEDILEEATRLLQDKDLEGMKFLITAGPTVEPMDPVRYMTNRSSGKMGFALARAASRRGADVTLVSGPTPVKPPHHVNFCPVTTTEEMREKVLKHSKESDVIIKAAAVLDYRPQQRADHKIKKRDGIPALQLEPTPDILAELGAMKEDSSWVLVGFAAETDDLLLNAREKLEQKNLDMIVANDVSREDAGFESENNRVKIIHRDGKIEDIPLMSKDDVADHVLNRVKDIWQKAF